MAALKARAFKILVSVTQRASKGVLTLENSLWKVAFIYLLVPLFVGGARGGGQDTRVYKTEQNGR